MIMMLMFLYKCYLSISIIILLRLFLFWFNIYVIYCNDLSQFNVITSKRDKRKICGNMFKRARDYIKYLRRLILFYCSLSPFQMEINLTIVSLTIDFGIVIVIISRKKNRLAFRLHSSFFFPSRISEFSFLYYAPCVIIIIIIIIRLLVMIKIVNEVYAENT